MSNINHAILNALPATSLSQNQEALGLPLSGKPMPAQVVDKEVEIHKQMTAARLFIKQSESESPAVHEERDSGVEQAVARLNEYVQSSERKLNFQVDEDAGLTVVRVYDKQSDDLIRQIPNEEALSLARKLNQEEPLELFSAQV